MRAGAGVGGRPSTPRISRLEAIQAARIAALEQAWDAVVRPDRTFLRNIELRTALYEACDGWSRRDTDGLDIEERNKLEALADADDLTDELRKLATEPPVES